MSAAAAARSAKSGAASASKRRAVRFGALTRASASSAGPCTRASSSPASASSAGPTRSAGNAPSAVASAARTDQSGSRSMPGEQHEERHQDRPCAAAAIAAARTAGAASAMKSTSAPNVVRSPVAPSAATTSISRSRGVAAVVEQLDERRRPPPRRRPVRASEPPPRVSLMSLSRPSAIAAASGRGRRFLELAQAAKRERRPYRCRNSWRARAAPGSRARRECARGRRRQATSATPGSPCASSATAASASYCPIAHEREQRRSAHLDFRRHRPCLVVRSNALDARGARICRRSGRRWPAPPTDRR